MIRYQLTLKNLIEDIETPAIEQFRIDLKKAKS